MTTTTQKIALAVMIMIVAACKSGPFTVFKPTSPHENYEKNLINSGLGSTAMGKKWIELSKSAIQKPVPIDIPYRETGYFPSEQVNAAAFSFSLVKGQKLQVKLSKKPIEGFMVYSDLFFSQSNGIPKFMASTDTAGTDLKSDIDDSGKYILRIQPELLAGGEYTLEITSGPSLEYPLKTYQNKQIRSFWGDGRDANSRKHEGIDIFSSFRTPVLAIADGITRVNENNLGGKVVWLRPSNKDFTLYYAHLDEQIVADGQQVQAGDTLGLMGNTGNARTTPPHLHFGIYTRGGAVDPLPFVNPIKEKLPELQGDLRRLNATLSTTGNTTLNTGDVTELKNATIVNVAAVSGRGYRVELPDGLTGFIPSRRVNTTEKPLSQYKIPIQAPLYDRPDSSAAAKLQLKAGELVGVLGNFGDYQLVIDRNNETGWVKK